MQHVFLFYTNHMSFLQVSGISKQYGNALVLKDTSFTQQPFQKISITGETGSGKSTLLKIIAGLEQPDAGIVMFENQKIAGPLETLVPGHTGIAYLSQHFELRNNYRMEELLEMVNKLPEQEAEKLFALCRISHLLKRKNYQLSGGEKQRIALARLLIGSPKLLLLDEPFSNLDPIHKNILKLVLKDICDRLQITCILTSHDPLDTLSWADEILVMKGGEIIQRGTPSQIYYKPVNEYAAGLFGAYQLLDREQSALFPVLQDTIQNGKRVFIRPEQFIVGSIKSDAVTGTIENIRFWGGFSELEIKLSVNTILVKTMDTRFVKGDEVAVSVKPGNYWQL
jgi:ABC-type sugar transport system ATPase subunit